MKHIPFSHNTDNSALLLSAFYTFLENDSDMVFIKDSNLTYVAASDPFVKMTGKTDSLQLLHKTDFEIFEDQTLAQRYRTDDLKLIENGQNLTNYIEPLTDENGYARYASTSKYILSDSEGNFMGILGISKDVTREYFTQQQYQKELRYLFELPADTYAAVFIDIDDWRIINQRRQLVSDTTMPACFTVEALLDSANRSFADPQCDAADFYRSLSPDRLYRIYSQGQTQLSFTYRRKMDNNVIRWIKNELRFITDPENGHLCVMLSAKDIDSQKRRELDLVTSAKLDKMTMLLNRESAIRKTDRILTVHSNALHALFMIDLDNFKSLNDTFGHQAGDEFLIMFSQKLKQSFREDDVVGRIAGDEFVILMSNIPDASAAAGKAERLLETIHGLCGLYPSLQLSASIGISLYPQCGTCFSELYSQADSALYQAKKNGKSQYCFSPS